MVDAFGPSSTAPAALQVFDFDELWNLLQVTRSLRLLVCGLDLFIFGTPIHILIRISLSILQNVGALFMRLLA